MKIKFIFVYTIAAILTATPLTASTTFSPNFTGVEVLAVNKTLQVKVDKAVNETVEISIETQTGTVVYSEKVVRTGSWKQFDLRQLEVGDYRLIVENSRSKTIQPFIVEFTSIKIETSERTIKQLPQVLKVGNGIDARAYLLQKGEISLIIMDNLGFTVFKEKTNTLALAKHYNLSKLPSGIYFIELKADDEVKYETITIK
jgi:hypothetical protein